MEVWNRQGKLLNAVIAAWRDVAPGSPFLERLYQGSAMANGHLPKED
jgi:hypothetical protein